MASIKWSTDALSDLDDIDSAIAERILNKISWLEKNFSSVVPEQLAWRLQGLYKLRVGDYRVVYSLEKGNIVIRAIKHRREIYIGI